MNREIDLTPPKFGEKIVFEVEEMDSLRGISNSDVLPTFSIKNNNLAVTIYNHEGEKISNRRGYGWVHTNFPCAPAEKQRKKLAEAKNRLSELRIKIDVQKAVAADPQNPHFAAANIVVDNHNYEEDYKKAEKVVARAKKKLCSRHDAQYGCSTPCEKCLSISKDKNVVKISGSIFFRNGYGASDINFVYFAVIKIIEGIPKLYVRRRPAKKEFMEMTAQKYQEEYVAKNKHIKNSFCICNWTPAQVQQTERHIEVSTPESGALATA